jgi:hypothetical protein
LELERAVEVDRPSEPASVEKNLAIPDRDRDFVGVMVLADETERFPERSVVETALGDGEAAVAPEVFRIEPHPRHVQAHDTRDAGEPALDGEPVAERQGIEIEMHAPGRNT